MGYPTRVKRIQRKDSEQWYINFPAPIARAMEFDKGEVVDWVIQDRHTLILHREEKRRATEAVAPPNYLSPALVVGLGLAGLVLALCTLPGMSAPARWAIGIIGTSWHLLAGIVGLLLLGAELFTRHAAYMGQNVNVLLATPASLALAVCIPLALRGGASQRMVRAARSLGVLAAVCAVVAVLLRWVPSLAQDNRPLLALAVPVHAVLAFAVWRVTLHRQASRGDSA